MSHAPMHDESRWWDLGVAGLVFVAGLMLGQCFGKDEAVETAGLPERVLEIPQGRTEPK